MTDRYQTIYDRHARQYQRLIEAEDCDRRILPALQRYVGLEGRRAVDVGAGTGRLSRLLLDAGVGSVVATDRSAAMLEVARTVLEDTAPHAEGPRWDVVAADARRLPFTDDRFDLAVAGWVFGHAVQWDPDGWAAQIDAGVAEMERVVKPGGYRVVFETMGTATEGAGPPTRGLARYYRRLEVEHGFERTVLATDYLFASVEEAADVCGFFFGEAMAKTITERGLTRVPEWTGMWVKTQ